jgi:lipopolysaccharide transport system permease protein
VIGSCMLNNALLFAAILVIFIILGQSFSVLVLWLIPLMGLVAIYAMSVGLILGVMNVFVRDIGQVVPIVLQMLFWFTPIVYPINIIPESYRYLLAYNPLYPLVDAYQKILVYQQLPDPKGFITIIFSALVLMALSFFMFRRASAEMVDSL